MLKRPLKIALLSATGKEGPPMAMRWAMAGHHILIGSRRVEKAGEVARDLIEKLRTMNKHIGIEHGSNSSIAPMADVVVPTMPYPALREALPGLKDHIKSGTVVLCPVCPLRLISGELVAEKVPEGSVAEFVARSLPQAMVAAAFHTVSAARLGSLSTPIEGDVPVCGDQREVKELVMELVSDIPNLRPFDGGALRNSHAVEEFACLVINIGRRTKKTDLGIKFV